MILSVSEGWYSYHFDVDYSHRGVVWLTVEYCNKPYEGASILITDGKIKWSSAPSVLIPGHIKDKAERFQERYFQMKAFW